MLGINDGIRAHNDVINKGCALWNELNDQYQYTQAYFRFNAPSTDKIFDEQLKKFRNMRDKYNGVVFADSKRENGKPVTGRVFSGKIVFGAFYRCNVIVRKVTRKYVYYTILDTMPDHEPERMTRDQWSMCAPSVSTVVHPEYDGNY